MKALSPESAEILVPSLQELTIRYADPYIVPRPIKSVANCPLKKLILFEPFLKTNSLIILFQIVPCL